MVAITVILAAVIGTFVLGLGDQVQETPSAGISVEQNPGSVGISLVDKGNVEGLQLIGPDGTKSTQLSAANALAAGAAITLRSDGTVETFLNDPDNNITILGSTGGGFTQGTFIDIADLESAIKSSPGGPDGQRTTRHSDSEPRRVQRHDSLRSVPLHAQWL